MTTNGLTKLRFGLVGGGEGAFIGQVHRLAAEMDGLATLVCGAFSSDAAKSQSSGTQLYRLPAERCYATYTEMFAEQARLSEAERMDFVVVATPNHLHVPVAIAALEAGFHVMCDKPLATSLQSAQQLREVVRATGKRFGITYNYCGYPMIRQARYLIANGALGAIRRVNCSYLQGWLAQPLLDNKQAIWRTDPDRAGAAGCFGDIGSHAEHLVRYATGLSYASIYADLSTFVPDRALDDDGNVLLRFAGGAKGVLSASQVAVGKENDVCLQVFGERGGLEWRQTDAHTLCFYPQDEPAQTLRTGGPGLCPAAARASRVPAGHPEGYLEAFATLYQNFCGTLLGLAETYDFPTIDDGVAGMAFIEGAVRSAQNGSWQSIAGDA